MSWAITCVWPGRAENTSGLWLTNSFNSCTCLWVNWVNYLWVHLGLLGWPSSRVSVSSLARATSSISWFGRFSRSAVTRAFALSITFLNMLFMRLVKSLHQAVHLGVDVCTWETISSRHNFPHHLVLRTQSLVWVPSLGVATQVGSPHPLCL